MIRQYPRFVFADRIQRASTIRDLVENLDLQRGLANVAFADIEPFVPAHGQVLKAEETPNAISLDARMVSHFSS